MCSGAGKGLVQPGRGRLGSPVCFCGPPKTSSDGDTPESSFTLEAVTRDLRLILLKGISNVPGAVAQKRPVPRLLYIQPSLRVRGGQAQRGFAPVSRSEIFLNKLTGSCCHDLTVTLRTDTILLKLLQIESVYQVVVLPASSPFTRCPGARWGV